MIHLTTQVSFSIETDGALIGKIERFHSKDLYLRSLWGEETAAEGRQIHEGDSMFTVAHQYFKARLNDRTILTVGPSTQVEIKNWTKRNSDNKLIREIYLKSGIVWLEVSKSYSQSEPFLVTTDQGVVAVRGTQFTVEAGEGGHLISERTLNTDSFVAERNETEVHTIEGEVFFAKNKKLLWDKEKRVVVNTGKTSLLRDGMDMPQPAHTFDLALFHKYFSSISDGLVMTSQSNERAPASVDSNAKLTADEVLDAPIITPSSADRNMSPLINKERRRRVLAPKKEED